MPEIHMMTCNGLLWVFNPEADDPEALGFLPDFIDAADPRPAREQFDANYGHGSYWRPGAATRTTLRGDGYLLHPGDPPLPWIASTSLRGERVLVYLGAFVAIVADDGSFVMQRMD